MTFALRRKFGLVINHKKVYRLCRELQILRPQRKVKPKHPRRLARNRVVTASNQLWETDIKYGYIAGEDRFFYTLSIIDVFDRSIIDYHIGLTCTAKDAAITLKTALWKRGLTPDKCQLVLRSDNGPQFISHLFEQICRELGVEHELIPYKTPNKNAHIESFHSILEEECLSRHQFSSFAEAYQVVSEFMLFYNTTRIHSGINYLTPLEYYEEAKRNSMKTLPVCA